MKNKLYILLLIVISFSLVVCNFIWLSIDKRPPHWDFAWHLLNTLAYLNLLDKKQIFNLIIQYHYFPPLSYYLTIVAYKFFGISEDIAVLSLTPYLFILIFSTYKIGQTLKNNKLGFLMAISLIGMPFLMSQTREYQLDFPLTAMVTLNLYLFLKTNLFKDRKFSLIFGCISGFGMLTKWTYLIFFVGMIIVSFILDKKKNYFIKFKNIIIVIIMMLLISGPWYLSNLNNFISGYRRNITNSIKEGDPNILSIESLLWYPNSLYKDHLRFPLLILSIIGLIYIIKNWKKSRKIVQLLLISLFYLLILTMFRNKDPRFIEPLTPILIILICFWIIELKNPLVRKSLIVFLILLSLFNYYISSFGLINLPPNALESRLFNFDIVWYKQYGYTVGLPEKENWHLKETIYKIADSKKSVLFILNQDKMFLNKLNIDYYRNLYAKNTHIDIIIGKDECANNFRGDYSYIVINDNLKDKLTLSCGINTINYYQDKEFILPDNSKITILKEKIYQ
jgi:4-amino-4-deoxy-L-arabinose transferase-like glycosyltransferase